MVAPHGQIRVEQVRVEHDRVHEMINDAFGVQEARRFYDQLEESSRPLCEGSPHSALRNRPNRNDEGDIDPLFPPISIFNQNGQGSKKRRKRGIWKCNQL
ncbi:hypothetical protein H5410_030345 [Solanum commersonii]|uniref:Uncharacterized protein n=1 Tax=Solanum commersonii TaxID=4109 RepID=A0A9J5YGL0_SOLCO|nr:hypothetical protein H5410_030345 [Solanum commersonii]